MALLFLGIHQLEGHVVVPNVMGNALRLHPLLVIFGLLAGGEIYGLPGALVALPLLAAGRAIWEFFGERVSLESWEQDSTDPGGGRGGGDARRASAAGRSAGSGEPLTPSTPLLAARGAGRRFGQTSALEPVELELWDGDALALVGPNGAGKSTLLALLAGALEASVGKVERRKGARVGWAPQRPAQYGRLSARENLELFARLEGEHDPRAAAERAARGVRAARRGRAEREPLGRQPPAAEPRHLAARRPGRAAARRADRGPRPRPAPAPVGARGRVARARGGAVVFATQNLEEVERIAEPRRRAARGPARLRRHARRVRPGPCRESLGVNRIALLLRKDVLVLRRSPLLLGILIAYPLAIALLVGLVASYGSSKPRVAFVDEDNLPATVVLGGKRFDVGHTIDEASKNVKLVRLSSDEATRELADGRVVAVVTVPPGFVSTLRGMVRSPQLELQLSTGTISSRVEQQVQALVYSLNRQLQRAYIASNLRYVTLILHGGDGSFLGAPITVLGIERAQRLLRDDAADAADGAAARLPPRRAARAGEHERRAQLDRAPDRARARARARAHVGPLGRGAGLRARADDHLPGAAARGRVARRRARRERRRPAGARARRARPARLVEGRARGRGRRCRARARDRARASG